jgi:serine/threonine-protein kinase
MILLLSEEMGPPGCIIRFLFRFPALLKRGGLTAQRRIIDPGWEFAMSDDPRVQRLLDELADSDATPEEICGSCPELLPQVRERWQQMCRVQAELDAVFPPAERSEAPENAPLPVIPGYEVEAILGRGGMGVVFRARHLRLNRVVALKMTLAGSYAGAHERNRFQREAEAVARLQHPNVVQVYDVGDSDGRPYFTMEYVDGGSLSEKLSGAPQPAREAAALIMTLAGAVQIAHRSEVVHRDLKPGNVLLTADGTPKISDFGLARRLDGASAFTWTGTAVGTPSYMAPEQARGEPDAVGPSADIYSLGAILYEMLTGRPPFRAESAAATVEQVLTRDPVPPCRLNPTVPRDLETICLKCLQKAPPHRYASAQALADDLRNFGEGRPIQARPVGWPARLWRWGRRNPTTAGLLAALLALLLLTVGSGLWFQRQQAERREAMARQEGRESQAVEAVLKQGADLQKQGRWPESREVLRSAPGLLGASAPADLRQRVSRAKTDADTVAELEEIRLRLMEGRKNHEPVAPRGNRLYAETFRRYGINLETLKPAEAAARIRQSAIRTTLLVFLHDWMFFWESDADRARLRAVLDLADDDDWRRRLRNALVVYDAARREELLTAREALDQPPVVLAGLAGLLLRSPQEQAARALLHQAQQRHPEDFWINLKLGYLLLEERPPEAVGYFRAAVASRPESSQAHTMLGRALREAGDLDGAISAMRKAISLNPNRAGARDLARALAPRGPLEEARAVWEKILGGNPPDPDPWYGYAQLCAFLGQEEAYRRARKALLERFADTPLHWTSAERNGLACLLLPASGDDLRRAVALADQAVAAGPKFPHLDHAYLQFVKGLADYRQGRPAEAIPLLRQSTALLPNRAGPRLALAMAQFQSGAPKEARHTLAAAVRAYNWKGPQADHTTAWVSHVLRREAEALLLPNLPAFLRGEYRPQDNDERLALVGACQFQGHYAAAARLYAEAFEADPDLADHLTTECRYRTLREELPEDDRMEPLETECRYLAARCAALAGASRGKDGASLSATERARWRRQARQWLQADLAQWNKSLNAGSELDRDLAKKMLTRWRVEPDLAVLLEPRGPDLFSADERKESFALWHAVDLVLKRIGQQERDFALDRHHTDPRKESGRLLEQGRMEEARAGWQAALETNPLDHNAWHGYAELCLFLGREDEFRRTRQALLARFATIKNPYFAERTGRACVLLPGSEEGLNQATILIARAAAADDLPDDAAERPYILFAQGLAEYRQGRLDRAISLMRGNASRVLGPAPRLVLAMALHRNGQVAEARKPFAAAVLSYDWRALPTLDQNDWMCHVLRREAERMIVPKLQAFLDRTYQPRDRDERLALLAAELATWEFRGLPGAAPSIQAGQRQNLAAWERAMDECRKLIAHQPTDVALLAKLGAIYQSAGRTRQAVPLLATASAANPSDTLLSLKVAALQAWFGQDRELAATRKRMLAYALESRELIAAERAVKACSIFPAADKETLGAALALARTAAKSGRQTSEAVWHLLALGMAEHRSGNFRAADETLFAAGKAGPNNRYVTGLSRFYRAMSLFRQGKKEEARALATVAKTTMKPLPSDDSNPLAENHDHDDLILWLAYKEANALIRFDAIFPPQAENVISRGLCFTLS